MSEPLIASKVRAPRLSAFDEQPRSPGSLRLRLGDVPALFSEGPEPDARIRAKARWLHCQTQNHPFKKLWPAILAG